MSLAGCTVENQEPHGHGEQHISSAERGEKSRAGGVKGTGGDKKPPANIPQGESGRSVNVRSCGMFVSKIQLLDSMVKADR